MNHAIPPAPIPDGDTRAMYRRRSQLGAGFAIIFGVSLLETVNAHHIHPYPLSLYVWAVLGTCTLASAGYSTFCWWRSKRLGTMTGSRGLSRKERA